MQRIRLGRIAGTVAAITLFAGLSNRDALALMAAEVTTPSYALKPGEVHVDLESVGIATILRAENGRTSIAAFTTGCSYDRRLQQRSCRSHSRSDSAVTATSLALRSLTGLPQAEFDDASTDTATVRTAVVNQWTDRGNHGKSISFRSTQRVAGLSSASAARTMDGADTTFRSTKWGNRFATHVEQIITFSNIVVPNSSTEQYPLSGVLYTSSAHTYGAVTAPRHLHSNLLVYFDGTRTPEAYMSGRRYTLNLETGIATPKPID